MGRGGAQRRFLRPKRRFAGPAGPAPRVFFSSTLRRAKPFICSVRLPFLPRYWALAFSSSAGLWACANCARADCSRASSSFIEVSVPGLAWRAVKKQNKRASAVQRWPLGARGWLGEPKHPTRPSNPRRDQAAAGAAGAAAAPKCARACSTMRAKAALSLTARSASTLRSMAMLAFFRPLANWL